MAINPQSLVGGDKMKWLARVFCILFAVWTGTEMTISACADTAAPPVLRKEDDKATRQKAAIALAMLGQADQPILDELIALMGERRPPTYRNRPDDLDLAIGALAKLGEKAVPVLVRALEDENYAGRRGAVEALGKIGPAAKDALPALVKALRTEEASGESRGLFIYMVIARWRIDADAGAALEKLLPKLESDTRNGTSGASYALSKMGKDAKPAIPVLIARMKQDKDAGLIHALRELAPYSREPILAALTEAIKEPALVADAAVALQSLHVNADVVIPQLLGWLEQCGEPPVGRSAVPDPVRLAYALVIFADGAKPYAPDLIKLLKTHKAAAVRTSAAWALARVSADRRVVTAALEEALKDEGAAAEAARGLRMLRGEDK